MKKIYINYYVRVVIKVIIFFIFLGLGFYFAFTAFERIEEKNINYSKTGELNYNVNLKENDFYETNQLPSGMSYIANLIDSVSTDFLYSFSIEENHNIEFKYNIIAKLSILDEKNKSVFYEKDYILLEDTKEIISNTNRYNIAKKINIDYNYYNNIANEFRDNYGVITTSNLTLYMNISMKSLDDRIDISSTDTLSLLIPLSERTVSIRLEDNSFNKKEQIKEEANVILNKKSYLLLSGIFLILSMYMFVKIVIMIIKIFPKKSVYDKYINKILINYDRFVAETKYIPNRENYEVVQILDFKELLDIRDNLKLPIMYYEVVKHQKCVFYILNKNIMYIVTVKAIDLENQGNEK